MLYFDLDGVLRMLGETALGKVPESWGEEKDGLDTIEIVNANPELCLTAAPSEYVDSVNKLLDEVFILTNQLPSWIPYTEQWLDEYLKVPYIVVYTKDSADKLSRLASGDLLIEDYPKFPDYSQIVLVTRLYNQHLQVPRRINSVADFEKICGK